MLQRKEVAFQEIDISKDPEAYEMIKSLGYTAAPIVMAGDDHWSGFRPDKLQNLA